MPVRRVPFRISALLQNCRDAKTLSDGKLVHSIIVSCGLDRHVFYNNLLIQMYGSCWDLDDARATFIDCASHRNVFSWSFIIRAYAEHGHPEETFHLFYQMKQQGMMFCPPQKYLCVTIFSSCDSCVFLFDCKKMLVEILSHGIILDVLLGAAIVNLYRSCKLFNCARDTFSTLLEKDTVLYNIMMAMCVDDSSQAEAFHLLHRMQLEGLLQDKISVITTLSACCSRELHTEGRQVHAVVCGSELHTDVNVSNSIISMYSKNGNSENAPKVFNRMERTDVVSWNAMISCFIRNHQFDQAFTTLQQMLQHNILTSKLTFLTILGAFKSKETLNEGKLLHACIVESGFDSDLTVSNALIVMYGNCQSPSDARIVFQNMCWWDASHWKSIIVAFAANGWYKSAFEMFNVMKSQMVPDQASLISILSAFTSQPLRSRQSDYLLSNDHNSTSFPERPSNMTFAEHIFNKLTARDVPLWNIMITAYVRTGLGDDALHMFGKMLQEILFPDEHIFASILSACACLGALIEGKTLHSWIIELGYEMDTVICNTLLNMYGKCGGLEDARNLFDGVIHDNVIEWTAIINAYALNDEGQAALELYQQMLFEGVLPDKLVLTVIFSASCSHATLTRGKQIHACNMSDALNATVTGNALINMYAKCGSVHSARKFFDNMIVRDITSWNAIITGYAQHGLGEDAISLFQNMQQSQFPPNKITFISVLSACSYGGMSYEAWYLFSVMHSNHILQADVENYNSMIDLLGRIGYLDSAESLIMNMPCQPTVVSWMTFLGACRYQLKLEEARKTFCILIELDPHNMSAYVLLASIYAAIGKIDDANSLMKAMRIGRYNEKWMIDDEELCA